MTGLALFDLDDTLIDREAAFSLWLTEFVDEFNLPSDAPAIISRIDMNGYASRNLFFQEIKEMFDIDETIEELLARYFAEYPSFFEADAETIRALRRLRALDWKIAVVTNGPPTQMKKLEVANLLDEVDAVCISEVLGVGKPEAGIFEEAARQCGRPLSGWMIGDSASSDIVGGHLVGLRTIWMHHGRSWDSLELSPDAVAASISEAVNIILA
jgi:HAD superfamily hydrolase (TIGR01549 family)